METNRLRQFRVVVETGNLRKAAEILGISHGGLSKSLKVLQSELGLTLFFQSGRGVVITDEGRVLYDRAQSILNEVESLALKDSSVESQPLRFASFEVFTSYFIVEALRKELKGETLHLREFTAGKLEAAIAENQVDLGITYEPIPTAGVEFVKTGKVSMAVFGGRKFSQESRVEELPFVVPILPLYGAPSGTQGLDGFPEGKVKRRSVYRVELLQTALLLASNGVAVGFFPKFLVDLYNKTVADSMRLLELRRLDHRSLRIERSVYLVTRESAVESPSHRNVAKAVRRLCY